MQHGLRRELVRANSRRSQTRMYFIDFLVPGSTQQLLSRIFETVFHRRMAASCRNEGRDSPPESRTCYRRRRRIVFASTQNGQNKFMFFIIQLFRPYRVMS